MLSLFPIVVARNASLVLLFPSPPPPLHQFACYTPLAADSFLLLFEAASATGKSNTRGQVKPGSSTSCPDQLCVCCNTYVRFVWETRIHRGTRLASRRFWLSWVLPSQDSGCVQSLSTKEKLQCLCVARKFIIIFFNYKKNKRTISLFHEVPICLLPFWNFSYQLEKRYFECLVSLVVCLHLECCF